MSKLYNLARVTTATSGTGTITLGAAVSGYLTFALAGVSNGEVVSYGIKDGANSEVGTGTYTSAGTTLTRTVTKSTNSDAAISLSGAAEVYVTARKEDFLNAADPLTSAQVAVQATMETATSTTLAVVPGVQHYHPAHIKAFYSALVTPTALPGAATSWDTTAETALWNTPHGMTTGDTFFCVTNQPAGLTNLAPYYVNAADTTHFSCHLTLADALAATNKVNITGTALTTGRKLAYSNVLSYGMPTTSPVSGVAASTAVGLVFNLSTALSSAICGAFLSGSALTIAGPVVFDGFSAGTPSTVATQVITYINATIRGWEAGTTTSMRIPGTWSVQATQAFSVSFILLGDQ